MVSMLASVTALGQEPSVPLSHAGDAAPPAASGTAEPPHDPAMTFRSGIDLVALNVVATDGDQNLVRGLTAGNFAVYEDGVRQEIAFFAAGDVPLDLAILIDTSASMFGKLGTAQEAAIGFASTLRAQDRLMVMDIKDATKVLSPLGADVAAAATAIRATDPRGGTALYNGLYLTLKELAREGAAGDGVRRQAIVVLSDGDDTASLMSFDDVMDLAKQSGIAIYTITLMPALPAGRQAGGAARRGFSQSEFTMKALARETGARAFFPSDIGELSGVYGSIAEELASQYSLGYTSKNRKRDGAYRRIVVQVVEPGGVRTRTRGGYLAGRFEQAAR
jgi:Ca-activated chloride channel family protein